MKVYILISEVEEKGCLKMTNEAVYLVKERAHNDCETLNERSRNERAMLAQHEQDRVQRLTGKKHPMTVDEIIGQLFLFSVKSYRIQELSVVISRENDHGELKNFS